MSYVDNWDESFIAKKTELRRKPHVIDLTKVELAEGAKALRHVPQPHDTSSQRAHWLVRCRCGELFIQRSDNLRKGKYCKCLTCKGE